MSLSAENVDWKVERVAVGTISLWGVCCGCRCRRRSLCCWRRDCGGGGRRCCGGRCCGGGGGLAGRQVAVGGRDIVGLESKNVDGKIELIVVGIDVNQWNKLARLLAVVVL